MDKEYVISVAKEIGRQIAGQLSPSVILSWGILKANAVVFKDMPSLRLKVNGRLHKGYVIVALDEGADYYRIYLSDGDDFRQIAEDVDFTQMPNIIDEAIESGTDEEEYRQFCKLQYNILMG